MAESRLLPAVTALEQALTSIGARYMLIGGVAVIARRIRRLTDDVDATLWAAGTDLDELLAALAMQRIVPRIEDAVSFAQRSQVLLLRHDPSGIDIDLSPPAIRRSGQRRSSAAPGPWRRRGSSPGAPAAGRRQGRRGDHLTGPYDQYAGA